MNYLSPEAKQNARSAAMAIFSERRANAAGMTPFQWFGGGFAEGWDACLAAIALTQVTGMEDPI